MAGTIGLTITNTVKNGTFNDTFKFSGVDITQNNPGQGGYTQLIGTTEEVVNFGDITTEGYMTLQNIDPTNYVTYGPESAGAMVVMGKLKPGEPAVFRVAPGVVMRAKADTAAILLDVRLNED